MEKLEIRGQVDTIQTFAFLRSARIVRKVQETCGHSNSCEIPSAYTDVKNSQGVNNDINEKTIVKIKEVNKKYIITP